MRQAGCAIMPQAGVSFWQLPALTGVCVCVCVCVRARASHGSCVCVRASAKVCVMILLLCIGDVSHGGELYIICLRSQGRKR